MQLNDIPNDVEAFQAMLSKWQSRATQLNAKRDEYEKNAIDAQTVLDERETTLRNVLEEFSRVLQSTPNPTTTTKRVPSAGTGGKKQKQSAALEAQPPPLDPAAAKQRALLVQGLTELFNGELLKDEVVAVEEEGTKSKPGSAGQSKGTTPAARRKSSPIPEQDQQQQQQEEAVNNNKANNNNAAAGQRLRESNVRAMTTEDVFNKVVALRDQRVDAEAGLAESKIKMERLSRLRTTYTNMQNVIEYAEKASKFEIQRCAALKPEAVVVVPPTPVTVKK
eukprot:PhM_4_TR17019/c1_g1_i1/m.99398